MPFALKRFISQFLMPVPLVMELFLVGWCLSRFTRFKWSGVFCKILAGGLFLLSGYGCGTSFLYRHERRYEPFQPDAAQRERLCKADVVVLGQTFSDTDDLPVLYRANDIMLVRLQEGVRVAKLLPEGRLFVSMAGDATDHDKVGFLDEYAKLTGVERSRIIMLTGANDTSDEARMTMQKVGTNTVIVVTSALHMPRAIKIFKKLGTEPVPAPCGFKTMSERREWKWPRLPLPSGGGFVSAENAVYEWLGMVYESITE